MQPDSGGQPEVVEHRGAHVGDDLPGLANRVSDKLQGFLELFPSSRGLGRVVAREDLQVLVGRGRRLGQAVVDVVGDATPFFFLGG